jgi:dihydrofolate reductase
MTMKLIATMMMSVDGVYQGPGGPDEDRRGGFERGGWAHQNDEEGGRILSSMFERADALLLGRRTWEIFESYWPHHDGGPGDPVSHGINVLPKYVPSHTLKDPGWNTHVIDGDVEVAVRELKAKPGRELQVHGSGELLRWLLERDLVDELNLRIYPVVVGDGQRLFPEQGQSHGLTLVESLSTPSGVTVQTYRPAGRATFRNADE